MIKVLMVAAENDALPRGKVGGVGDVVRDAPRALATQGVSVDVIIPGYGFQASASPSALITTLRVPFAGDILEVALYRLEVANPRGVRHWTLEHPAFVSGEPGQIYFDDGPTRPFASDANKFALFGAAVCELLIGPWKERYTSLHLHDWHSAFVALLAAYSPRYKTLNGLHKVYSIHNLAIQGIRPLAGDESSLAAWFPELKMDAATFVDPRYPDCINPMRAGINLSDVVHVVSPTYATEVVKPSDPAHGFIGGEGLERDLQRLDKEGRLHGILNGCDYDVDLPTIPTPNALYQQITTTLKGWQAEGKIHPSHALALTRLKTWQRTNYRGPLLTSLGRLTQQKMGLLLLPQGNAYLLDTLLDELAQSDGRLILLGSGDNEIEEALTALMRSHDNLLFLRGYAQALPHSLYKAGDLFLMPSTFEPCGISQLLAMRSGQPCLVHAVGGLKDTVEHLITGFSFSGNTPTRQGEALLRTLNLALDIYQHQPGRWQSIRNAAAERRFDWQQSAMAYMQVLYR